jgi:hypothetical protein
LQNTCRFGMSRIFVFWAQKANSEQNQIDTVLLLDEFPFSFGDSLCELTEIDKSFNYHTRAKHIPFVRYTIIRRQEIRQVDFNVKVLRVCDSFLFCTVG